MKQTTEVSENQTPEACSSIQVAARVRHVPVTLPPGNSLCEASRNYAELSCSTPPFLSLHLCEKDLPLTLRLLRV
jgi:hypothetical protein